MVRILPVIIYAQQFNTISSIAIIKRIVFRHYTLPDVHTFVNQRKLSRINGNLIYYCINKVNELNRNYIIPFFG